MCCPDSATGEGRLNCAQVAGDVMDTRCRAGQPATVAFRPSASELWSVPSWCQSEGTPHQGTRGKHPDVTPAAPTGDAARCQRATRAFNSLEGLLGVVNGQCGKAGEAGFTGQLACSVRAYTARGRSGRGRARAGPTGAARACAAAKWWRCRWWAWRRRRPLG